MYNLKDDVCEHHILATENPDTVQELDEKMHAWRKDLGAKMPTKNTEQGTAKKLTKPEKHARKQARKDAGDDD